MGQREQRSGLGRSHQLLVHSNEDPYEIEPSKVGCKHLSDSLGIGLKDDP